MFLKFFKNFFNLFFFENDLKYENFYSKINKRIYFSREKRISFFSYKDYFIKKAIWTLKFKANQKIINIFSNIILDNLYDILEDLRISDNFNKPKIIIIPSTKFKKFKRGYNQNELIIKNLMRKIPKNFIDWEKNNLIKIKNNREQNKIKNKKERIENVQGVFFLKNPEKIKDENIIIFDDILTSGATTNEAKKILKKAGAKNIIVMTLAH